MNTLLPVEILENILLRFATNQLTCKQVFEHRSVCHKWNSIMYNTLFMSKYFKYRLTSVHVSQTATWSSQGKTVAGGHGRGSDLNQLNFPWGIFVDTSDDNTLYVVDTENNRVVKWRKGVSHGELLIGGNGADPGTCQLGFAWYVTVDQKAGTVYVSDTSNTRIQVLPKGSNNTPHSIKLDCCPLGITLGERGEYLYVSDIQDHRVLRYDKSGSRESVVAGGQGRGGELNQLVYREFTHGHDFYSSLSLLLLAAQIYVDDEESVYVADSGNDRIMKWAKDASQGEVVAGGNGQGAGLNQLHFPTSLHVDRQRFLYIADQENHRIVRWLKGAKSGTVIVNGITASDLCLDQEGNLYVCDAVNNCVQVFAIQEASSRAKDVNSYRKRSAALHCGFLSLVRQFLHR